MWDAGLCGMGPLSPATLGIFFVRKGAKQRMIMDTRRVNQFFVPPVYTALPTSGSWCTLQTASAGGLHLSQIDVADCFHRMQAPPGAERMFI